MDWYEIMDVKKGEIFTQASSIVRLVMMSAFKYHIGIDKRKISTKVLRFNKGDTSFAVANIYYHESKIPSFVALGPTLVSADGEYKLYFITYDQIKKNFASKDKISTISKMYESIITERLASGKYTYSVADYSDGKYELDKKDAIRLIGINLMLYANNMIKNYSQNNINNDYFTVFNDIFELEKKRIINCDKYDKRDNQLVYASEFYQRFYFPYETANPLKEISPRTIGHKLIPLTISNIRNMGSIVHSAWRELYISLEVEKLIVNGINSFVPYVVDWFLIDAHDEHMFNNDVTKTRYLHSKGILNSVKNLYKSKLNDLDFDYVNNYNKTIDIPITYAESHLVMSGKCFVLLNDNVGSPLADIEFLKLFFTRFGIPFAPFMETKYIKNLIFDYAYTLAAMNRYNHIIHGDLHLNNLLVNYFYSGGYRKELCRWADYKKKRYILKMNGRIYCKDYYYWGTIIDFSRSIIDPEHLAALLQQDKIHFSDYEFEELSKQQEKKFMRILEHTIPEWTNKNSALIGKLIAEKPNYLFKVLKATDMLYVLNNIKINFINLMNYDIIQMITKMIDYCVDYLKKNIIDISNNNYVNADHFNELFIRDFFEDYIYNPKDKEEILICDKFTFNKEFKYDMNENAPPVLKKMFEERKTVHDPKKFSPLNPQDELLMDIKEEVLDEYDASTK